MREFNILQFTVAKEELQFVHVSLYSQIGTIIYGQVITIKLRLGIHVKKTKNDRFASQCGRHNNQFNSGTTK